MSKTAVIEKELLEQLVAEGQGVYDLMARFGRSKTNIAKHLKKYGIKTPSGFFHQPGTKPGRPKGIPMSEEQKRFYSDRFSGEGNPFHGRHHSDKTRQRMSKNHANFTGDNNPFKRSLEDPEKLHQHKERCQQRWDGRDAAWRAEFGRRLSKAMSESDRFQNAKFCWRYKSCFLSTKKAGTIFCRSSWEQLFALYLDEHEDVPSFALEPFCIPYVDEIGAARYSRIDFHIVFNNGSEAIIEVKPKALQALPRSVAKFAGYRQFCDGRNMRFGIVDEDSIHDRIVLDGMILSLSSPATP